MIEGFVTLLKPIVNTKTLLPELLTYISSYKLI